MKFFITTYPQSKRNKPQKRWFMLWFNSQISIQHNNGMPNYLRYEGRKHYIRITWGTKYNPTRPTIFYQGGGGYKLWKPKRTEYPAGKRA